MLLKPSICMLFAAWLFTMPCVAQEGTTPKSKGKAKGSPSASFAIKRLGTAELTTDQKKQIRALGKDVDKAMQKIRKEVGITPELAKQRQDKIKELADSIKNYRKRVGEAEKSLDLPPEQVDGFESLNQLRKKLISDATELLTDEQKGKLSSAKKGKGKKKAGQKKKKQDQKSDR